MREKLANIEADINAELLISTADYTKGTEKEIKRLETELKKFMQSESNIESQLDRLEDEKEKLERVMKVSSDEMERMEFEMIETIVRLREISTTITDTESKITNLQSRFKLLAMKKHNLLMKCKTNDINIDCKRGSIKDVIQLNEEDDDAMEVDEDANEQNIEIDFEMLSQALMDNENAAEIERLTTELAEEIEKSLFVLDKITDSNFEQRQTMLNEKLNNVNAELEAIKNRTNNLKNEFESVKNERLKFFTIFFNDLSERIDSIYKQLTGSADSHAQFIVEVPDEPYKGGIIYEFEAPGRHIEPGEIMPYNDKFLAAFALLIALYYNFDTSFWIFHEFDEALETNFVKKIASIIKEHVERQVIVITGRLEFSPFANSTSAFEVEVGSY